MYGNGLYPMGMPPMAPPPMMQPMGMMGMCPPYGMMQSPGFMGPAAMVPGAVPGLPQGYGYMGPYMKGKPMI